MCLSNSRILLSAINGMICLSGSFSHRQKSSEIIVVQSVLNLHVCRDRTGTDSALPGTFILKLLTPAVVDSFMDSSSMDGTTSNSTALDLSSSIKMHPGY
mmetsp:Transcript_12111/g.25638  ORF Transcript_12111/g.25638 Transcript_12111/m.25638 type:complete len:100 (+) Transcript_12111:1618-1917(+)